MDIKQLKYFLQLCKNNNFSETAKELYITQQGLSKSIKSLEEELQLRLFHRNGNGIQLTKQGLYIRDKATNIVEEFDVFKASIERMSRANIERVKVGYSLGVIRAFSYEFLYNFKKNYTDLEIDITEYNDFSCEKAILNEEIDIGITVGPVDETKFHCRKILAKEMCLIVNEKRREYKKDQIKIEDIKNEKFIIPSKDYKLYNNFIQCCRMYGFEPNIVFSTEDINLVTYLSCVGEAVGVGINFENTESTKFIPFDCPNSIWEAYLITKKGKHMHKKTKVLMNHMINCILSY